MNEHEDVGGEIEAVAPLSIMPTDAGLAAVADGLVDQARADGVASTGEGWLLTSLIQQVLRGALEAEITDHLGHDYFGSLGQVAGSEDPSPRVVLPTFLKRGSDVDEDRVMEMKGLSESHLDLVFFALNQAIASAKSQATELAFVVIDREEGRELTWLEDPAVAPQLADGSAMVVVTHEDVPAAASNDDPGAPRIVLHLTDSDVDQLMAQAYRPGGSHRRFAVLGEPFEIEQQPA